MNDYIYLDNTSYPVVEVVFECKAIDILVADEKYKKRYGQDPMRQKGLAVVIQVRPEKT